MPPLLRAMKRQTGKGLDHPPATGWPRLSSPAAEKGRHSSREDNKAYPPPFSAALRPIEGAGLIVLPLEDRHRGRDRRGRGHSKETYHGDYRQLLQIW